MKEENLVLVYLAENGCGLILLLCLRPNNESWGKKKKRNFSPKGARLQNEEKKQNRIEDQNSIKSQSFLFFS